MTPSVWTYFEFLSIQWYTMSNAPYAEIATPLPTESYILGSNGSGM